MTLGSKQVIKRDGNIGSRAADRKPYHYVILAVPPSVWAGVKITAMQQMARRRISTRQEIGQIGMGDCREVLQRRERTLLDQGISPRLMAVRCS